MPTSIYKSLNFGDLEPTRMTIELENRSIVFSKDVLVQVNELIFPTDFYVLDMEDELGKGSTLILGRPFLVTARTKIDVHVETLSIEFGNNLVQFNIFEAMRHPTKDPSLFGINVIDELVAEYMQLETDSAEFSNFAEDIDVIGYLGSVTDESNYDELLEVQDLFDFEDDIVDLANLDLNSEFTDSTHQVPNPNRVDQLKPRPIIGISPLHSPSIELKSLSSHLKGEIVASLKAAQEGNRVAIVRPSRNKSLNLSSTDPLYDLDPKIELTLRRLRRARNIVVNNSSNSNSVLNFNQFYTDHSAFSSNIVVEPGEMEINDRTLKELATPDVYPQLEPAQTYELKSGLIHLLPKFHGLAGEDPDKHLKEFHVGILEDYIKMKAFPFSLDGAAKDWLYLQPVLFNTWEI
ncbi:hypothetical protein CR513_46808, partial [Mucuna pruriens]